MRKLFYFALVLIGAVSQSVSQDRQATSTIEGFVASGGVYSFDIVAQRTGPDTIRVGTSSFFFMYNAEALINPTLSNINPKYTGTNGATDDYAPMTVGIIGGKIGVTITFTGNGASGKGQLLSDLSPELMCTVHLEIRDALQSPGLEWSTINSAIVDSRGAPSVQNTFVGSDLGTPLPIQLASFTASVVRDNDVEVAWKTVSETNNYGFEVYRKRNENGAWTKLGFVEGHGTTLGGHSYTYIDRSISFGKYYYRIKQIDLDGKSETYPEMSVVVGVVPNQFALAQNYPNPFNPSTMIEFVLPKETHVKLDVYNALGQRVAALVDEIKPAGFYEARLDATGLASGLYFYRLSTNETSLIRKMMILK